MRNKTPEVNVGGVIIGGNHPIVIQSMTDTNTEDSKATAKQCMELADAGSELVRITVNTEKAALTVPKIRQILDKKGYKNLPLIGDFHYNGHLLLENYPECAKALAKYRINPGNVGYGDKHDYNFATMIKVAIKHDKPVRIGVNWGSIDQDLLTEMMETNAKLKTSKSDREVIVHAMVKSAMRSAQLAEATGLAANKIVVSVKMSIVQDMISVYELLQKTMNKTGKIYAIHLGLTEAGVGMQGVVSSSAALAILMQQGIGDTIRISLTPAPKQSRAKEVVACKTLLQSMGYRHFRPQVTSCPGCGRTNSNFFQDLAKEINEYIDEKMPEWREKYPKVCKMKVAVMGCIVNGPGESKHADIAISLPGRGEEKMAPVFIRGRYLKTLIGKNLFAEFVTILEDFIKQQYS